jgi:hypothetical protein
MFFSALLLYKDEVNGGGIPILPTSTCQSFVFLAVAPVAAMGESQGGDVRDGAGVRAQFDQAVQELAEEAAAVRALEVEWGFVDSALLNYSRKF